MPSVPGRTDRLIPVEDFGVYSGILNKAENLQAAIDSPASITLGRGQYRIDGRVHLSNHSDKIVSGVGMNETQIAFDCDSPIYIDPGAEINDLVFKKLTIISNSPAVNSFPKYGIIAKTENGPCDIRGLVFDRVGFSNPYNHENAVKFVMQGGDYLDGLKFIKCRFDTVARMGVEVWSVSGTQLYTNRSVVIDGCEFRKTGNSLRPNAAVESIALSLVDLHSECNEIKNCRFVDLGNNPGATCGWAIELLKNNHVDRCIFYQSPKIFVPFSGDMLGEGNSSVTNCRETHNISKSKNARKFAIYNSVDVLLSGNQFYSGARFEGCSGLRISDSLIHGVIDLRSNPSSLSISNSVIGSAEFPLAVYSNTPGNTIKASLVDFRGAGLCDAEQCSVAQSLSSINGVPL